MNTTTAYTNGVSLLIDGCYGIYVPQRFVINFDLSQWTGISDENKDILMEGPDNECYWYAWDEVLDNAKFTKDGHVWHLYQDGDLWALCSELMSEEEKSNFGMEG